MTNGTTATSTSENWESYSDASELDHDSYQAKSHGYPVQRAPAPYGRTGAPPAKTRAQNYNQAGTIHLADENHYMMAERLASVEGSEGAWSTEVDETY